MSGGGETHVIWITLEWTVFKNVDIAESGPSEKSLRKVEGAVLDFLRIQAAVGAIVDILEEEAVHCRAYGHTLSIGLDVKLHRRTPLRI